MIRKLAGMLTALIVLASVPAWAGRLHPEVEHSLGTLPTGGRVSVIVEMTDQANPAVAAAQAAGRGRAARKRAVRDALLDHANRHQGSIRAQLAQGQAVGRVSRVVPLWIFNGLVVTGNEAAIRQLAARSDVKEVRLNRRIPKPEPTPSSASASVGESEWNIAQIRAPEVWALAPGYDGTGSVVGSFDTGVDGTHPDLAPSYRGNDAISWFDPYGEHATPYDNHGHGTHTTGIAVGGNAGGTHIGVAPGAKWIAAKAWNDADFADVGAFHQIFQWFLAPGGDPDNAPDVVNGSWVDDPACTSEWRADVQALRAAGIFPSFASGNNGPFPGSAQVPGIYPEAFAVGATDETDSVAFFSGRGPSDCDNSIKPDISAPGVSIVSTFPGGFYIALDGTSMATPHVTGAVAVLRSINQGLTVDELEAVLRQGAVDLGAGGPDNAYGTGRLDLFLSAQLALDPNRPFVTVTATDPTATEAGTTTGTLTVTRTGSTGADLTVHLTVGGTATADSDYAALPETIVIPAGSATATLTVTPIDDAEVEPNETVIVALAADPAYIVGSAGQGTVSIVNDDLPSDLVVSTLTTPPSVTAGGTISATETTLNQGGGVVSVSTFTRIYLSTTSVWTPSSVVLGTRTVGPLGAGQSSSGTTSVTIPAGTAPGSYFLLAYADASNAAAEGDDSNNSRANPVQVVASNPDLVVSALTTPPSGVAGAAVSVTETTANQGIGDVTVSTATRIYLSSTPYWTASSVVLGTRTVGPLGAGQSSTGTTSVTIPAGTTPGSYYVLAYADAAEAVPESNNGNNSRANPIQVAAGAAPDLVVSALTTPPSGVAGAAVSVTETTANQGGGSVTVSTATRIYLSPAPYWTGSSVLLGTRTVGPLGAGQNSTGTTSVTIPAGTTPGNYYLLAYADAAEAVPESNNGNNSRANPIQVTAGGGMPDLVVSALTTPPSGVAGAAVSVTETTRNQGAGNVTVSTATRIYLSPAPYWTGSSVLLGTRTVGPLGAGQNSTGTTSVTIPAGTTPGNYYLLAYADAAEAVPESNNGNNSRANPIQVSVSLPDLVVATLSTPPTAAAGATISVDDTTANQGTAAATVATWTRFYLSTTTYWTSSSVLLASRNVTPLGAGQNSTGTTSVTIPAGTAAGNYYLLAYADASEAVTESNNVNNSRANPIAVTTP